jgi:hypothetical protein
MQKVTGPKPGVNETKSDGKMVSARLSSRAA